MHILSFLILHTSGQLCVYGGRKHVGFVAGCIGPAMVILLVVKLLDFFFLLFMCIAKS